MPPNDPTPSAPTRFDTDTAVKPVGGGSYEARIDSGWWVVAGPNGGYLAALLVRALEHVVGDTTRHARSLTVHYARPPAEGPARIETNVEREGRALSTVSARLLQEGRLVALAVGAFSKARTSGVELFDARMPEVPPPERCEPIARRIPIQDRFEYRWAIGTPPFDEGQRGAALCGGWIRLAEPRVVDASLAAAMSDAFPPALFSAVGREAVLGGVPTVDLTVHFRATLPRPEARPDEHTLAVFRSHVSREGFIEEDGELWSADGVLLAQSRQLALAR
ncbi:MAG: thioesterase family protein [Myxococcota bacterium]|nr:thioesterase family protein [Myxococcota bacterium]